MKRILVVYYSQSGDVTAAAEAFVKALRNAGATIVMEQIRPKVEYPFPWRTPGRLFDVFPECILARPPAIHPMSVDPDERFDLVILAYQIWFLAPSLPVQGFLQSDYAKVLDDTKVITICVNRKMWHSGSEAVKERLRQLRAIHIDNVVVTYLGPPWTTFVTVFPWLLQGRRDTLWGIFPIAGVGQQEVARLERLGAVVAEQLDSLDSPSKEPLLKGHRAVEIHNRSVVPELVGWYSYRPWARVVLFAGRCGRWVRRAAIYLFMVYVVLAVLVGLPIGLILSLVIHPFVKRRVSRYARRLAEPSGE
ncbi:MAG: NADPH-dependent FMN reductase family protein [Planctomycetota bacterium]|jgi:hypothetical protein